MKKWVYTFLAIIFVLWFVDFRGPCGAYTLTNKFSEVLSAGITYQCPVISHKPDGSLDEPPEPWYAYVFNIL